jgi:hypothetical protein
MATQSSWWLTCGMSSIINAINETVLVLGVAVCLPRALGELIRACVPVMTAIAELRDHISAAKSHGQKALDPSRERKTTELKSA